MIKGAIVGCGRVASQYHIPCYQMMRNVEIVAVCDTSAKRAITFSRGHHISNYYTEISELFEKESLDFIDICTPPSTHYTLCSLAMDRGVNTLVEKPITVNIEETLRLQDKSKKKRIKVCVIQNYRFKNNVLRAWQMKKEGRFGRIRTVLSVVHSSGPFPEWFWNEEENGGILYESAIHFIDLQTLLCGEHRKVLGLHKTFNEDLGVTTDISAIVEYKSGAIGIIDVSAFSSSNQARLDLYGTAADVHLKFLPDYFSMSLGPITLYAELKSEVGRFLEYTRTLFVSGLKSYRRNYHFRLLSAFIKSIEQGSDPPVTIDSVVPTMKLLKDLKGK